MQPMRKPRMRARDLGLERLPTFIAALSLLSLLASVGYVEDASIALPTAMALLVALSACRPAIGLVVLSSLVPVSVWLGRIAGLHTLRLSEALVLAVLAGALVNLALGSRGRATQGCEYPPGVLPAALWLMAAAVTSVVIQSPVFQFGASVIWPATADLAAFMAATYLYQPAVRAPGLADAALLVEGIVLLLVILACSTSDPRLPRRLAIASLAGATGAAIVNLSVMDADIVASAPSMGGLTRYITGSARLAGATSGTSTPRAPIS